MVLWSLLFAPEIQRDTVMLETDELATDLDAKRGETDCNKGDGAKRLGLRNATDVRL
jgi:hypothetical protein